MALEASEIQALRPDALGPADIEAKAETLGKTKAEMPKGKAFVLAIAAGMFIGMGGMFMLLVKSDATFSFATSQLLPPALMVLSMMLMLTSPV